MPIRKRAKQGDAPDTLLQRKEDRRLLAHVPDPERIRVNPDRRGGAVRTNDAATDAGQRYTADFPVRLKVKRRGFGAVRMRAVCHDVSQTGILLSFRKEEDMRRVSEAESVKMKFRIPEAAMPEGMETKVNIEARPVRTAMGVQPVCGLQFTETLAQYVRRKKDSHALTASATLLFVISLVIVLMRVKSVLYFKFDAVVSLYSIIAATFLLSRYFFGALYRPVPVDYDFTPSVSIIIPCFNEEQWIDKTIFNCVDQDYPVEKLEVIIVDDHSTDNSVTKIREALDRLYGEAARYRTRGRVRLITCEKNGGKRTALSIGARAAKSELLVFVDSDSFLKPDAIRNVVQPFRDPKTGGVSGRTDVANAYTNDLTKLQAVRYYISFRIMKAAEAYFDAVTCLSGPLSCYRKSIVLENMDAWLSQTFLGQRATFGDDRSLTNFVLRGHRTYYQDTAICETIVPNRHRVFLRQQMRWKRSWLRESVIASGFIWKKEPLMAVFFYMGLMTPILAPIIVLYNLIWVPFTSAVFPTTFLLGLFFMAMMMSFAHLFFKKSSIWLYGLWFVLYYECVLLWQMPIAWVTFWKSTWGTRDTPEDIKSSGQKRRHMQKNADGGETGGKTTEDDFVRAPAHRAKRARKKRATRVGDGAKTDTTPVAGGAKT